MSADRYELAVGLEIHVQLATRTKIFCRCSTEFGAAPNINTCPVCLGLPGALPVLNEHAVRLAVRTAIVLGCQVNGISTFARKHYFYPDLPRGYQVTQFDEPLASGGSLEIGVLEGGTPIVTGITRVHLEEDAGRLLHDRVPGMTAVDLNRAGVPLVEIVTEPCLHAPEAAGAFLRVLRQLLEYAEVSDCNMEAGHLRVDANVSARVRGATALGTRTEVKNLNSFSAMERAIAAEFARQCAILESGGTVERQTMLWDDARGVVRPSRRKEGVADYRYFPEPDLPPLALDAKWVTAIRSGMPEMPAKRCERMIREYGLGDYQASVLTVWPALADYFEGVARAHDDFRTAANWVMGEVLGALKAHGGRLDNFPVRPPDLAELLDFVRAGTLSTTAAKQVFARMVRERCRASVIVTREGLARVDDHAQLAAWVDQVLAAHPREAERLAAGEQKLRGMFVGAVMKRSGGAADPRLVDQMLAERFGT